MWINRFSSGKRDAEELVGDAAESATLLDGIDDGFGGDADDLSGKNSRRFWSRPGGVVIDIQDANNRLSTHERCSVRDVGTPSPSGTAQLLTLICPSIRSRRTHRFTAQSG